MSEYNRANPSPRYQALLSQYKQLHLEGDKILGLPAEKTFPGQSLFAQAVRIKALIKKTNSQTILDYGSGKGRQYLPMDIQIDGKTSPYKSIPEFWHINKLVCYDPGYEPFSRMPSYQFDGVICTDVLEHCPEEDIAWLLEELFGFTKQFVFSNIAFYPAEKILPNGENAHCTIKPIEWWQEIIEKTARHFPNVIYEFFIVDKKIVDGVVQYNEQVMRNFSPD